MRENGWLLVRSLSAEHHKMNHTKMASGQHPDKFIYIPGNGQLSRPFQHEFTTGGSHGSEV